ncbi:MAG: O-antigen ligase family protein, partial [Luteolibacter sp.]
SVVIAPQLRIWTWGPTSLCFAMAILAALPEVWKNRGGKADLVIVLTGFLLVCWLAARAAFSPVKELAQSDLLLTAMAVATFVSFRSASRDFTAQRIFLWGTAMITAASLWVVCLQMRTPGYMMVFPDHDSTKVSGFFAHYSYGASFLIVVSLVLAAFALFSREKVLFRVIFGTLALMAAVAVYYTRSRGGILGLAGGGMVLVFLALVVARRQDSKWFSIGILVIPLFLLGVGVAIYLGMINAHEARGYKVDIDAFADSSIRLYLYGIAFSCIGLHPWIGGGARSFSWECFQFWDGATMSQGRLRPEHVHNELLQTITDYGFIGFLLLLVFVFSAIILAVARIVRREAAPLLKITLSSGDAWRIGGLAGFCGIFVQSNFEGIFRIPPGAILMAFCLSAACITWNRNNDRAVANSFRASLMTFAAVLSIGFLAFFGWKGTRVSLILWDTYFSETESGLEAKSDAITKALKVWPLRSLREERGILNLELLATETSPEIAEVFVNLALDDFTKASVLNPFDPGSAVSAARILSNMDRNEEAEAEFHRAIKLSGDMEPAFEANFQLGKHLYGKGLKQFHSGHEVASLDTLRLASIYVDRGLELSGYYSRTDRFLGITVHQNYGKILEKAGEYKTALEEYRKTLGMRGGGSSHYFIAILYGNLAKDVWKEGDPSAALTLFILANESIREARALPKDITPEKRNEYAKYLQETIKFIEGAKYKPSENIDQWLK